MAFARIAKNLFSYSNTVIAAAFLTLLVTFGALTAFGVFFTPMLNEFGWTKTMTSGAYSLNWIVDGAMGVIVGKLCDRFGPRWIITVAGILMGIAYLLMSQMSSVWHIYLFFGVILGIGMGGIWVPVISNIARMFVVNRNMVTGIVTVGGGVGSLLAPPIANWFIAVYSWRTSYIILGAVVLVMVVAAAQLMRPNPGLNKALIPGKNGSQKAEKKSEVTGLSLKAALYTQQFWLISGMMFLLGFLGYLIQVHIAPYAIESGISAASAANILATIGGLTVVSRMAVGGSADRIGNRRILAAGFILMVASLFLLLATNREWSLYLFSAVFGLGFGCGIVNSAMVAELFGLRSHGVIFGFNVFGYSTGCALGPFVAGYVFDITGSYQLAFLMCAIAGILALIIILLLRPIRKKIP